MKTYPYRCDCCHLIFRVTGAGEVIDACECDAPLEPITEYEAARAAANEASEVYAEAQAKYRCGGSDDDEFLAARVEFKKSQDAFDLAFEKEQNA